jgi:V8-like Glu-specific endopeptidase
MLRRFETTPLIRALAVLAAVLLAAICLPAAAASAAQAAKPSPYAAASSRVAHSAMASTRASTLAYWTPSRLAHAKSADALIPHGKASSAPLTAAAAGPVHRVAPVAGAHRASRVAGSKVSPNTIYESATIGKIFFSVAGGNWMCSGSSLNSDSGELVLTAGHCIYDVGTQSWVSNFVFIPEYANGSMPYGEWTGVDLVTFVGFTQGDGTLDTGFVAVSGPGNLRNTVGAMGIVTGYSSVSNPLLTMGYPGQSPNWQYYCEASGTLESDGYLHMPCGQQPGASGSPIMQGFDSSTGLGTDVSDLTLEIIYSDGTTANAGPIFTLNTWSLYSGIQGVVV